MNKEKIEKIIEDSEAWLAENVERFDPFGWKRPENKYDRRKAFAELGMYVYVSKKLTGDVHPDLQDAFESSVTTESYVELIKRYPQQARLYAAPLACAVSLGLVGDDTTASAQEVLDHPAVVKKQRIPMRELDLAQLRTLVGLEPHLDVDDVVKRSSLEDPPHVIQSGLNDAYILTHDVFYCYEFGHTNKFLNDPSEYDLTDTFDGLSLRYFGDGHTDIALELIMTGVLMNQISNTTVAAIVDWISSATEELGFVPGPPNSNSMSITSAEQTEERNQTTNDGDEWDANYHTNLIAAIAGKVLLMHGEKKYNLDKETPDGSGMLADAVDLLSKYKLRKGAVRLRNTHLPHESYPHVTEQCLDFLRSQRNTDGTFGQWPDERYQFMRQGGEDRQFREGLVAKVSQECKETLKEVTNR